jgi:hypothetical protein
MLHNGKKIFPSAERVVRIPKTTEATAAQWFWVNSGSYGGAAWLCHDGDSRSEAIGDQQEGSINWLVYDMGERGKRIDHVDWNRVLLSSSTATGYIILTNAIPNQSLILPPGSVILRYNDSGDGLVLGKSFDNPDKVNRYRYLCFSTLDYEVFYSSIFYEIDIYEIV